MAKIKKNKSVEKGAEYINEWRHPRNYDHIFSTTEINAIIKAIKIAVKDAEERKDKKWIKVLQDLEYKEIDEIRKNLN